jgi:diadenosine tetraphosphate (Ap4A) HIT family hydrolase
MNDIHHPDTRPAGAPDCLFCAFDHPDLNTVLLDNATCYARLDNYPVAAGHVEVVPKRHVESFFDLHADEVADAYSLIVRARMHLQADYAPDGYTIGVNEGPAAGRTIDHVHIHLVPRWFGDVEDPRGGIRCVVPGPGPDAWMNREQQTTAAPEES